MSITVFITTRSNSKYSVDLTGHERVADLYSKAAHEANVQEGSFTLDWNGWLGDETADEEVQSTALVNGSELTMHPSDTATVSLKDLAVRKNEIESRLRMEPNLMLVLQASDSLLDFSAKELPVGLRHLTITDPSGKVDTIAEMFLCDSRSLQTVDLSGVSFCIIQGQFMTNCTALKKCVLPRAREIGTAFLYNCTSLQSIDLAPLSGVKMVPSCFLSRCVSLKAVDLEPFSRVGRVEFYFMNNCTSLLHVDLRPLRGAEVDSDGFIKNCPAKRKADHSMLMMF
eukprot:TRINITY_DN5749_c0_g1_i1.p1 TRINITY_DN5749_c0_g1~~TRINITY_DN5749_c0_g1_i1.p1  ORF type:complete len:300 (+),score=52.24 TRINITY_DN5749_c0_g1_i1:50-901(+)